MDSYFGRADRVRQEENGKIVNPIPLWTNEKYKQDLKNNIRKIEQHEREGFISTKEKANKLARKKEMETLLKNIEDSDPRNHRTEIDKDSLKRVEESWRMKIKGISPYLQDDPKKPSNYHGVETNPAEESLKSKQPCIKLDTEEEIREARKANLKVKETIVEGKRVCMISRDDATRACKLLALAIGMRVGYESFRNRMPFGQRSNQSSAYSDEGRENHGRIFGDGDTQTSNSSSTVTISKDEYAKLKELKEKVVLTSGQRFGKSGVKTKKKARKPRAGSPWTCPDCNENMTTLQKGLHKSKCPEKEKAKEKELVTV